MHATFGRVHTARQGAGEIEPEAFEYPCTRVPDRASFSRHGDIVWRPLDLDDNVALLGPGYTNTNSRRFVETELSLDPLREQHSLTARLVAPRSQGSKCPFAECHLLAWVRRITIWWSSICCFRCCTGCAMLTWALPYPKLQNQDNKTGRSLGNTTRNTK